MKQFTINISVLLGSIVFLFLISQTKNLQSPTPSAPTAVEYTNNQYGFKFALPTSWKGYSIVTGEWKAIPQADRKAM